MSSFDPLRTLDARSYFRSMSERAKIVVEVTESIVGPTTETLWAERTPNGYRLLNSPFYAKGLSYRDEVEAQPISADVLAFKRKVATEGHSTYRLIVKEERDWSQEWATLQSLGCTFEGAGHHGFTLLAVDVPPNCDLHHAYELMEAGHAKGVWDFEEADVNHPL